MLLSLAMLRRSMYVIVSNNVEEIYVILLKYKEFN